MLKSKYEGNIIIRNNVIQVAILNESKPPIITESSIRQLLFDYKNIIKDVPEPYKFENLNGKMIKGYSAELFISFCKRYKGRRLSNNLAKTVVELFEKFGYVETIHQAVGYEINEKINKILTEQDNAKKNKYTSEFDNSLMKAIFNKE